MSEARWTILAVAALLVAAGVVPLLARATRLIGGATPSARALDWLWLVLPVAGLAALVAAVAAS